uniref:Uncharacterized protein n=1 Tax=Pyrodinium bahamense TaxID=73915 RepID=A0A7R9ZXX9_9DINO
MKKHQQGQAKVQRRRISDQRRMRSLEARLPMPRPLPLAMDDADDYDKGRLWDDAAPQRVFPAVPEQAAARRAAEAGGAAQQARAAGEEQLADLVANWPAPKSSPHYSLKVWQVLAAVAREGEAPARASAAHSGPPGRAWTGTPRERGWGSRCRSTRREEQGGRSVHTR